MNTQLEGELAVHLCKNCSHCQTKPLVDLTSYYQNTYELGRLNEKDDQLYRKEGSELVYRAQHQSRVLLETLDVNRDTKLLDFGCGKSLTLHSACSSIDEFKPYLYDVSDKYLPIWLEITTRDRCAVATTPTEWSNSFDIVTSFYALEHIVELDEVCQRIRGFLKNGGTFYFLIPNIVTNPADFMVADHVNHFSASSITAIMNRTGFMVNEINTTSHDGAIICVATKQLDSGSEAVPFINNSELRDEEFEQSVRDLATFWGDQETRLHGLISEIPAGQKIAVYGAGFYGVYLSNLLLQCGRKTSYFIDMNPYLQGTSQLGADIIAPDHLPGDVKHVLVGLNPVRARKIISEATPLQSMGINLIFIES